MSFLQISKTWIAVGTRLLTVLSLVLINTLAILNPEEFPNLLAGSFTDGNKFSTGNTLPLVGRPWGFNHWAPQTRDANRYVGSWWFSGNDHTLTWIRCTHQPSPWIGDWGFFMFSPQVGGMSRSPVHFWEPRSATIKPYLFDTTVAPYNIRIELTPTDHAAIVRITFPRAVTEGKFVCFSGAHWGDHGSSSGGYYLSGQSVQVHSERMIVNHFVLHMRAESTEAVDVKQADDMLCFQFKAEADIVHIRIATSLISAQQLITNMRREVPYKKSFDQILGESKLVWNRLMRRVNVLDAGDLSDKAARHLTVFYTGLYRALTFPRKLEEMDENGKIVHYSPYDPNGQVHPGPLVTDNGFWDTFRTVYPLLSLIYPDLLGDIIQGWLNAYKEGGWLPSWASPGYRNCMVGTFADVVIADAIVKNVPGFEVDIAVAAIMKDAFEESPRFAGGAVGKEGLGEYDSKGYLAFENGGEVVSRTIDYGFADFSTSLALAHVAKSTSDTSRSNDLMEKAVKLFRRSSTAFSSLYDRSKGLMVPKDRLGSFSRHFSPIEWGNGYTEGNSWHHSFPPYSISCTEIEQTLGSKFSCNGGLAQLHGGKDKLLAKLKSLLTTPSNFQVGSYGQEIHEMTEMRAFAMGQYGHNNQPVHHILYLFAMLGDGASTQEHVREVLNKAYGEDYFAGDEDNGEQGAWFVLSALGLFSVTPGTPDYILGSPLFRHVRIARCRFINEPFYEKLPNPAEVDEGEHIDIFAFGTKSDVYRVDQVKFGPNTVQISIQDSLLQNDGVLRFFMSGEDIGKFSQSFVDRLHAARTFDLEGRQSQPLLVQEEKQQPWDSEISIELEKLRAEVKFLKGRGQDYSNVKLAGDGLAGSQNKPVNIFDDINVYFILVIVFIVAIVVSKMLVRYTATDKSERIQKRGKTKQTDSQSKSSSGIQAINLTQRNVTNAKGSTFTV